MDRGAALFEFLEEDRIDLREACGDAGFARGAQKPEFVIGDVFFLAALGGKCGDDSGSCFKESGLTRNFGVRQFPGGLEVDFVLSEIVVEIFGRMSFRAWVIGEVIADEVNGRDCRGLLEVVKISVLRARVVLAEFFVGEETFLNALEGAEFFIKVGNGFAGANGFEETCLDEAEKSLEVCLAMSLVVDAHGGGELSDGFGTDGFRVVFGVVPAE